MNWIISYPRSGNTAARYLLETLTGKPSDGVCFGEPENPKDTLQPPLVHKGRKDFCIKKGHSFKGVKPDDFVLFIIRDPLEAVIRHNQKKRGLHTETLIGQIDNWFGLLRDYDNHLGNKMLWYYDHIKSVSFPESLQIYPDPQSKSKYHHQNKLSFSALQKIDNHILSAHTELYEKYLLPHGLG